MTPWHSVPDPWPVDKATPLDDGEYADALDQDTPRADRMVAALTRIETAECLCSILCLGRGYRRGEIGQGYYVVAVRAITSQLLGRFARMGILPSARAQLALSQSLVAPTGGETRELIVGWAFREV